MQIFVVYEHRTRSESIVSFRNRGCLLVVSILLAVWMMPQPSHAQQDEAEPEGLPSQPLWPAPEPNMLGISAYAGYTFADFVTGPHMGAKILFFFKYFVGGLAGGTTLAPDGPAFQMLLDLTGRYGPLHVGLLTGLHWLPGKGGAPASGFGGSIGVYAPLGISGFYLDFSYRPNLIFLDGGTLSYHALNLGLIIEAGQ
jgi:hypothetical protein